jgi:hypothetical protein
LVVASIVRALGRSYRRQNRVTRLLPRCSCRERRSLLLRLRFQRRTVGLTHTQDARIPLTALQTQASCPNGSFDRFTVRHHDLPERGLLGFALGGVVYIEAETPPPAHQWRFKPMTRPSTPQHHTLCTFTSGAQPACVPAPHPVHLHQRRLSP